MDMEKKGVAAGRFSGELLLIDKPKGISSFDVIRELRKIWRAANPAGLPPKMGYAGTLDPLASGLMLVGVGAGTKKLGGLLKLPKTYEAEIFFGARTATGDAEGEVVERKDASGASEAGIRAEMLGMLGKLELAVPAYSAVKVGGEPLYEKARRGAPVSPPVKTMEILAADFLGAEKEAGGRLVKVRWRVSSGTYVRSLAEELGRRLGFPAMLKNLRRTSIGDYPVDGAYALPVSAPAV